jgi:hypothetical protein
MPAFARALRRSQHKSGEAAKQRRRIAGMTLGVKTEHILPETDIRLRGNGKTRIAFVTLL